MKHDPKLIAAWEAYSGLAWTEDYQGEFALSFRDFSTGWKACKSVIPVGEDLCQCSFRKIPEYQVNSTCLACNKPIRAVYLNVKCNQIPT